jgi:hypothetical protein
MKGEIAIIAIIAFLFAGIGYMAGRFETYKNVCNEKGGMLVDSPSGWVCIKGEKI